MVSAHPLASKVGFEILKQGGNAVDAAIATQLALAVVYPGAGNIGGGGFMVARLADGKDIAIDYREKAPGKAHRDMYLDSAGNARTDKARMDILQPVFRVRLPDYLLSSKYAKLPFEKLIQPAIDLAEKGFVITASEAKFEWCRDEFEKLNTVMPVFVKQQTMERR